METAQLGLALNPVSKYGYGSLTMHNSVHTEQHTRPNEDAQAACRRHLQPVTGTGQPLAPQVVGKVVVRRFSAWTDQLCAYQSQAGGLFRCVYHPFRTRYYIFVVPSTATTTTKVLVLLEPSLSLSRAGRA